MFPVIVLTGPRQVGKTSLLTHALPHVPHLSLDVGALAEMATSRPEEFLRTNPPPVVIDEVQYAPSLFRHLKTTVDAQPGKKGLFVLTGSQTFALMHGVADSLAGRAAIVSLLGLSGAEWRAAFPTRDWTEFLWRGSFPALWADDPAPDRERWYASYLATYLERDVRNVLAVSSLRDFDRFVRACAARSGGALNLSDLARDVGVAPNTARAWLGVLQASNIVILLEPYFESHGKRITKTPKLYFTDTGLLTWLLGVPSPAAALSGPRSGAIWESYVVGQWLRWRDQHRPGAALWWWRDQAGHEVDLIVEDGGKLHPIECKRTERPDVHDARGLAAFTRFYGSERVGPGAIACTTPHPHDVAPSVVARSGWTPWSL